MPEPLEYEYFEWLCAKVTNTRLDANLMMLLHRTEFVWVVHADSHRAADGIELRQDFLIETGNESEELWEGLPCSVLEVLIAFAKRAEFQTGGAAKEWFWVFLTNLHLDEFRSQTDKNLSLINEILNTFIWRTYDPRGFGGMFPLPETTKDQRDIELFYQWCEWVDYNDII